MHYFTALSGKLLLSTISVFAATAALSDDTQSPLAFSVGNGVTLTPYGYIKADFIWDDGYDLGDTTSGINSIGLPSNAVTGHFNRQILKETRLGIDVNSEDVMARFEGDFYGPDGRFRLRHAFVDWQGVIAGQNWTNYMSVEAMTQTVDFQGAGAAPFARLPQLRYTYSGPSQWTISGSIEEDIGNSDDYQYTFAARKGLGMGMVRIAGLWRDTVLSGTPVKGWGVNLATVLSPWDGGTIRANLVTGSGTADILNAGLSGNAVTLNGNPVGYNGIGFTISHQVNEKLEIATTGSWLELDQAVGNNTKRINSLHLSAFYSVRQNTVLMAEFFTGERTQGDGLSFDTKRYQLAIKYSF